MAKGKYEYWLTDEGLTKLGGWARAGLTDEQIAHNIGISRKTLDVWKRKYGDIGDTLKRKKEIVDYEVENALLRRALGYVYEEERIERSADGVKTTTIRRPALPDTTAQIFWLKNRMPDKWRDKQREDNNGEALDKLDALLRRIDDDAQP